MQRHVVQQLSTGLSEAALPQPATNTADYSATLACIYHNTESHFLEYHNFPEKLPF